MKYRIMFEKTDAAKYIAHLDLNRIFQRACRRAGLPLAFSQGFNPHPKISFAIPLAVGVAGEGEFMELELTEALDSDQVCQRLNEKLPVGIKILAGAVVQDKEKPLMARVTRATYRFIYPASANITASLLRSALEEIMNKTTIEVHRVVKRKNRQVDIRPYIFTLAGEIKAGRAQVTAEMAVGTQGNVKPVELITELAKAGLPPAADGVEIYRTGIYAGGKEGKVELW